MRGGLLDDTLVVFTSDHGEMLGDHNLWRKTYAYEASARVPFIVKPPSYMQVERNIKCSQLVGWEDIMPTFLEAAGAPIPATVEGQSALPFLKDNTREGRSYYHGEHSPCYHPENANQFLTDATWKYIWNPINGEEQLFNLSADPSECSDLAHTEIAVLEDWRAKMAMELAGRDEDLSDGSTLKTNNVPAWRFGQTNELHLG